MGLRRPRLGVVMALEGKFISDDASFVVLVFVFVAGAGGSLLVAVDENKENGIV